MHNVILFALSTLPQGSLSFNDFHYDEKTGFGCGTVTQCGYQLEPALRMILDNTPEDDAELLLLSTKDTLEKTAEFKETIGGVQYDAKKSTAVNYLFERLNTLGYIPEIPDLSEALETGSCKVQYQTQGRTIAFHVIRMDESDEKSRFQSINFAVNDIWHAVRENGDRFRLYLIANGGLRGFYLTLNSIIAILQNDKIYPEHEYSTIFNRKKCEIIEDSGSFDLITFVSGMNEFILHGNVDSFERYYSRVLSRESIQSDPLLNAMRDIADGTQFSDTETYTKGLNALRSLIRNNDITQSEVMSRPEFNMFRDNIVNDYGNLLSEDHYVIDVVEHCRKKKLYQQALTFAEAKIHEDFIKSEVISYSELPLYLNGSKKIERTQAGKTDNSTPGNNELIDCFYVTLMDNESADKDVLHYIFMRRFLNNATRSIGDGKTVPVDQLMCGISEHRDLFLKFLHREMTMEEFLKELKACGMPIHKIGTFMNVNGKCKNEDAWFPLKEAAKNNAKQPDSTDDELHAKTRELAVKFTTNIGENDTHKRQVLTIMLIFWALLKLCRNKLNHGDDRTFSMDQLDGVLSLFYDYGSYLFRKEKA